MVVEHSGDAPTGDPTGRGTVLAAGFAGEPTDAESGLVYLRARSLDPATGRFLSVDPLAAIPGWAAAPYSYAENDPVNRVDPSGLKSLRPGLPTPVTTLIAKGQQVARTAGQQAQNAWNDATSVAQTVAQTAGRLATPGNVGAALAVTGAVVGAAGMCAVVGVGLGCALIAGAVSPQVGGALIAAGLGMGATGGAIGIATNAGQCRDTGNRKACAQAAGGLVGLILFPGSYAPAPYGPIFTGVRIALGVGPAIVDFCTSQIKRM